MFGCMFDKGWFLFQQGNTVRMINEQRRLQLVIEQIKKEKELKEKENEKPNS